jgi:hypothetical protein
LETASLTTRMGQRKGTQRGSRLLLDASRCGHGQAKLDSVSTHTRVYQQGHVTAKETARLCLWSLLWTPLRGLPPRLHVPPLTVATPSLRSQLYVKSMYKAPMPYPHLNPCTSGGMSMTIAPPRGPTQKRCLGPQVLLRGLVHLWERPLSKLQVGSRWEVNVRLCRNGKPSPNEFWIDEAWEFALFNVAGLLTSSCDEGKGTQSH